MKTALLATALALALPAAHAATPFDETRPLQPDGRVSLDNLKGRIEVTTWERAEIRIEGQRGEGTEALRIDGDAAALKIKIEYPERSGWFGGWGSDGADESELRVTLPKGATLEVDTVSAEVDVRGVAGRELSIDSVSGDVRAQTAAGTVDINTVSGDASLEVDSDEVRVEAVSGDVEIEGAVRGRASLEAVSGGLRLSSSAPLKQVDAGVVSGKVELRTALQPGARVQAESLSGDLILVLPKNTSARVSAESFSGSIRSDQGKVEREEHGPGSSLDVTLGGGDARIDLETFSGDLTIRSE